MKRFCDTIRQVVEDHGMAVLDDPDRLMGMLEDYGAFRDEGSPCQVPSEAETGRRPWCRLALYALIAVCVLMALTGMVMIILFVVKGGSRLGEWIWVFVSSLFNIYLLHSFL
jgi:hypothetical protein